MKTGFLVSESAGEQAGSASVRRLSVVGALRSVMRYAIGLLSVFSGAKSFRGNPVIGSPSLNRHGLHILRRTAAARLGARRRRALAHLIDAAEREEFSRDGFIIKRDFLDPATYKAFSNEITSLCEPAREALIGDTLTRLIALDGPTLGKLPTVRGVLEGARFRNLISYVGSFQRRPSLYVQTVFSQYAPDREPDIQSFFHSDTFHPTVKAWLFLFDIAPDAAPFTYVPGSHKANRRRLAWERRVSVGAQAGGDRLTAEGSFRITESEIRRLGYPDPVKFPVAANTLIVADTSGIHRRSVTEQRTTRVSIWAYSRSNPFLPWTGGDVLALPGLSSHAQRLYWAASDRVKDAIKARRDWHWVGKRSPLDPASPQMKAATGVVDQREV